ncbi:MAG TPA: PAS-domain containing protein [Thermohalobaculum sp.]|nr:PAS-domain containing protein [Thermohalobaculum sp.]
MALTGVEFAASVGFALGLTICAALVAVRRRLGAAARDAWRYDLADGAVLLADSKGVVAASADAETLLGPMTEATLPQLLRRKFGEAVAETEAAADRLLREGAGFRTRICDADGQEYEVAGEPRGGLVRLTIRNAGNARDEPGDRGPEKIDAPAAAVGVLDGLLAGLPLVVWSRDAAGAVSWVAGGLRRPDGSLLTETVAAQAAERAEARNSGAGAGKSWFRLQIPGGSDAAVAVLDAIEVPDSRGGCNGIAVDAATALVSERTLARFVHTMTETFAHLTVGMAIFDRNETLVMFNPAMAQMWQADPAWLARKPKLREIIDTLRANRRIPETPDFHAWRRRLTDLFQNTETADYEELWHLADGSDIRVLARPHPHGSLAFVFDDVTERLRLEQQYRHSVDLRRATLDRLDEGLAVFGPDGLLQLVNTAFHEFWGTDAETVRPGLHARDVLPLIRGLTVETEVWVRLMTFITGEATRQSWNARLTLGDGRILGGRFVPLPDGSTMAVFGDVTDSERIALALRERNEALESAEEMRAAVLDQISHRLRTPLNTVFGFAQLMSDPRFGDLSAAQREYAQGVLDSARHLLATVDEVTELAALEIDSLSDPGSDLPLAEVLMLTGRLLERRATEEGVRLRIVPPEGDPCLACDIGRLRQFVFGMMTDAIRRCRGGGLVELGVRAGPDGTVEIFTAETLPPGREADLALAEAESLALPVLRRLIAREGGSFHLAGGGDRTSLSAVCAFRTRDDDRIAALDENRLTPGADLG